MIFDPSIKGLGYAPDDDDVDYDNDGCNDFGYDIDR